MKITCRSCEQPIEVDDGVDFTGAQCPSCGAPLIAPGNSPPGSTPRKLRILLSAWFTAVFATASFLLAIYCVYRVQKLESAFPQRIASADPTTTIKNYYRNRHSFDYWTADGAFEHAHGGEIVKTLETVSTNGQGDYILALVRYSVGDKVFRDGVWLKRVGGEWYIVPYLSTSYKPVTEVLQHRDWFEQAEKKKDAWEAESADRAK